MPRQGEGVYVGEGVPPVPTKLAKRIRSGKYVEMEELLPEVCTREDGEPEAKRQNPRRALNIFTWLQCFGVYVSVRGAQFPEIIQEVMAYMSTIIRVNREYAGQEWIKYNMLFWKHMAHKKDTRWSVINPTIYARYFTAATRNPPMCEVCLAITHETKDCSQKEETEGDIEGRLRSMEQTIQNLSPVLSRHTIQFSEKSARSGIRETAAIRSADTLTCAAYVERHTQQFGVLDAVGWVPKAGKHTGDPVKIMRDRRSTPAVR